MPANRTGSERQRQQCFHAKSRHQQSGAAMTEFVVFGLAMMPLFTLLPTMARIADINQSSAQASRYGAWERTVSDKSAAELGAEISARLLAHPSAAIQSNQAGDSDAAQNPFWNGTGTQRLFDASGNNLGISLSNNDLPNVPGAIGEMVDALGSTIGALVSDDSWGLGAGGLYTASVSLTTHDDGVLGQQEGSEACNTNTGSSAGTSLNNSASVATDGTNALACIRARNAILVDSWSARDRAHVEERVRSLVPAGILRELGEVLGGAQFALPVFQELGSLEDAFGHVDADELPPDRVGTGR